MVYYDADGDLEFIDNERELHYAITDDGSNHCLKIDVLLDDLRIPPSPLVITVANGKAESTGKRLNSVQGTEARASKKPLPIVPLSSMRTAESIDIVVQGPLLSKGTIDYKIISSLLELHSIGILKPARIQVAMFAGYTCLSSTGFAKAIIRLKKIGYLTFPNSKCYALTTSGRKSLPQVQAPHDNDEVHQRMRCLLDEKTVGIFNSLLDGSTHLRFEIASKNGYSNLSSTGYAKAMSKLRGLSLIVYPDKNSIKLTDIAFPFGRPPEL
mmetsp:Transcript_18516/g.27983  ORF Transcript_18516/g.27983 Transcript_18516/m.27983 type:complete len:269 (+) Transcript_18516:436-1242(+)